MKRLFELSTIKNYKNSKLVLVFGTNIALYNYIRQQNMNWRIRNGSIRNGDNEYYH